MTSIPVSVANTDAPRIFTKAGFDAAIDVSSCQGCGDHGILAAVHATLPMMGVPSEKMVFVSGIACSSPFPYYTSTHGMHAIHGRAPAIATGLKSYRPDLHVWVVAGDDFSIGGNHVMEAMRRNVDINVMLFTDKAPAKSAQSSIIELKAKAATSVIVNPFKPLSLAINVGATFVARVGATDAKLMPQILLAAQAHKGTSFVEVLQNNPVLDDGVWGTDKATRAERQLVLEHGKPMLFAGGTKGVGWVRGKLDVVDVREGSLEGILVHDVHDPDPSIALALAQWDAPNKPIPMGILRAVERPTYDHALKAQIDHDNGDLQAFVTGNATWKVA